MAETVHRYRSENSWINARNVSVKSIAHRREIHYRDNFLACSHSKCVLDVSHQFCKPELSISW